MARILDWNAPFRLRIDARRPRRRQPRPGALAEGLALLEDAAAEHAILVELPRRHVQVMQAGVLVGRVHEQRVWRRPLRRQWPRPRS
jgi:hypothetical protein